MENVYYINVRVDNEEHYGDKFGIANVPVFSENLKIKIKNEKYLEPHMDSDRFFDVYASNIIYLEED